MSRLRTLLLFAALAGAGHRVRRLRRQRQRQLDESPAAGSRRSDLRRDRKRRPRPLGQRRRAAATKAATSTSASPARSRAKAGAQLPELDLTAEANGSVGGKDVDFDGGIVLVPNKAYVSYEGERLRSRPDHLQLRRVGARRSAAESGAEGRTERRRPPARKKRPASSNVDDFVDNLTNEGSADVGGTEHDQGQRRPRRRQRARRGHRTDRRSRPAARSSKPPARCPCGELEEAQGEIEKALKSAHVGRLRRRRQHRPPASPPNSTIEPEGSGEEVEDRTRPHR